MKLLKVTTDSQLKVFFVKTQLRLENIFALNWNILLVLLTSEIRVTP